MIFNLLKREGEIKIVGLLLLLAITTQGMSAEKSIEAAKYELALVWVADRAMKKEPAYIFTINNVVGFSTVVDLKKYIETMPKGSILRWAPGCDRMGDEPLLASEKDLKEFKSFCEKHDIELVMIPSG